MENNESLQNKDFLTGESIILQWSIPERALIFHHYIRRSFKTIIPLSVFFCFLFLFFWYFKENFNSLLILISILVIAFVLFILFAYIMAMIIIFILSFLSGKKDKVYFTDKGIWTLASLGAFIVFLKLLEWKSDKFTVITNIVMGNQQPCFISWQNINIINIYNKSRMFYLNNLQGSDSLVKIFIATEEIFNQALEIVKEKAPQAIIKQH